MRIYWKIMFILVIAMSTGCAVKDGAPTREQMEMKGSQFNALAESKVVSVVQRPYLGAKAIVRETVEDVPVLNTHVVLRQKGTLREIASSLSTVAPLSAQVSESDIEDPAPKQSSSPVGGYDELGLPALPMLEGSDYLDVSYSGTLRGLLDVIASLSGYGWDYDAKENRVTFSAMQVRTYTIMAAPGTVTYDSQVSNKSKERSSSSSNYGSSVNTTVQSGDTSAQTAQIHKTKLEFDVWKEVEQGVKALLSKRGSVSINQAAGTVTVKESYARLRQIGSYIDEINKRLAKQVAITVRVWSLELTDTSEAGLNLQALFENNDVSIIAGSLGSFGSTSTAAATVVKGKLKDSSATIKALKQWGTATQLTSGGGLLTNNQPLPIQAIKRHAYIAGMTMATSEYNQTSEITPGEVTSGFSLTLIPHILEDRRVILQYNVTLSSLDALTEIDRDSVYVQLPEVSTRSFSQRSQMKMGQTLVLAGFEQAIQDTSNSYGLVVGDRSAEYTKSLIVVTIELESAENV